MKEAVYLSIVWHRESLYTHLCCLIRSHLVPSIRHCRFFVNSRFFPGLDSESSSSIKDEVRQRIVLDILDSEDSIV